MKLALIGNYGATNVGDDAILASILKSHANHEWTVFSANPEDTQHRFKVKSAPLFPLGIRSLSKFGFRTSYKALKSVEAVVLGGGGLFQDNHIFACFLWAWQVFWVKRLGKPLFIYATGVGPLKTWMGMFLTRWVYDYASGVTVRDKASFDKLVELGVDPAKVEMTADPAFLFKGSEEEKTREPRTYIVSLRPWLHHNPTLVEGFAQALLKLKSEKGATFAFVCMQSVREHDLQVLGPLAERVGGAIVTPNDFAELVALLQRAEFAIGMRYHFLIAALIARTPTLALGYSPKVLSLYEGDLAPYCMGLEGFGVEALERKLSRLSLDYNKFKLFARRRAQDLMDRAAKNPKFLEGFIKTLTKSNETDKLSQQ
jgi:polysaccharide pyruvyl transferase CsaB